jgi:hypothetical protein
VVLGCGNWCRLQSQSQVSSSVSSMHTLRRRRNWNTWKSIVRHSFHMTTFAFEPRSSRGEMATIRCSTTRRRMLCLMAMRSNVASSLQLSINEFSRVPGTDWTLSNNILTFVWNE